MLDIRKYRNFAFKYAQKFVSYLKNTSLKERTVGIVFLFIVLVIYMAFFQAPRHFPENHIVNIQSGETISGASAQLKEENIIRSPFLFKAFSSAFGGKVLTGDYHFNKRQNVISVANRLSNGKFGIEAILVTIPEGFTSYQIGERLGLLLPDFNVEKFNRLALRKEGRLFPDTYKFLPNASPEEIIRTLENNFEDKTKDIMPEVEAFDESFEDVLIMASLLEREARQYETKRVVAGVLWKRIEIGMALQVDAVFGYIKGTETFNPTFEDLEIDSPYNTYENPGLPPGPISNPGIESIRAAVNPIETNYLYYLTGKDGVMRYSETFEGHVRNRRLYLN